MNLQLLATFLAVATAGSVQAAARQIGISRSTVRRHLDGLEAELNVALFQVHDNRRVLTPTGDVLAGQARLLLDHAALLANTVKEVETVPSGDLTIALPSGLATRAMARMHQLMIERWPELRFALSVCADPCARLPDEAHLAVTFDGADPGIGYDTIRMGAVPLRLLASPRYLARRGPVETVEDLADHALLFWESGGSHPRMLPTLDGRLLPFEPRMISNDAQMLRAMAQNGAGLAFAPDSEMPAGVLVSGDLVRVLDDVVGTDRKLDLVVPTVLRSVPKVRVLLDMVEMVRAAAAR